MLNIYNKDNFWGWWFWIDQLIYAKVSESLTYTESKGPLISICIPTFNRVDKVFKLVSSILTSPENDFEVIVLDNCSTDNTKQILLAINDARFIFVQNTTNIGGTSNPVKALTLSKGKYAFLCLDKDFIKTEKIGRLIEILRSDQDVVFGRCALDIEVEKESIIYEKGYQSVKNMAYLSAHPTGNFYLSSLYKNLPVIDDICANERKFGFNFELINAQMALLGKSLSIESPIFYTETEDGRVSTPSYTYAEKDIYFLPSQRQIEFDIFLDNLTKLNLSKLQVLKLTVKLYMRLLFLSTIAYKRVMTDASNCTHYGIATRKVSLRELININIKFAKHFWNYTTSVNCLFKVPIILCGFLKFLLEFALSK